MAAQSSLVERRSDVQPGRPPAPGAVEAQRAGEHVLQRRVERPPLQGQAGLQGIGRVEVHHELAMGHPRVHVVHGHQQGVDLVVGAGPDVAGVVGVPHLGSRRLDQEPPRRLGHGRPAQAVVVVQGGFGPAAQVAIGVTHGAGH